MKHDLFTMLTVASLTSFSSSLLAVEAVHFTQDEIDAKETALTDFPLMRAVKSSIATRDNRIVERVTAGNVNNPANVKRLESIVSEVQFEFLFPVRADEYTYQGLLRAAAKFPALCGDYDEGDADAICRQSLATMFAHFAQETGAHDKWLPEPQWRQGLYWVREMGWDETKQGGYNTECDPDSWQGEVWPCGKFANGEYKSYFGRGAKQLSYNYNYGPFSYAMFGDVSLLLDNPERVADTWLNLASAVFFFTYPQPPKPSMLHVIDGTWQPNTHDLQSGLTAGFGMTTHVINGGIECGGGSEKQQSINRIEYYQAQAQYLGVEVKDSEVLGCKDMKPFDVKGAGAMMIYWELDWSYIPGNPNGGKSYACKLVGYQTRYSAFKPGDYLNCLMHFFPEVVIDDDSGPTDPNNQAPTAKISGVVVGEGGSVVVLDASSSNDPEGKPLNYLWRLPVGARSDSTDNVDITVTLPNLNEAKVLSFSVTVTDEGGLTDTVHHAIRVHGGDIPDNPPAYQVGYAYISGDKVSHAGGIYECKPFPYTAWCAGAAWAYEPGVGTSWQDAWIAHK